MMEMWSLISHLPAPKLIFFEKEMKGVAQLTITLSSWPQLLQADDIDYIRPRVKSDLYYESYHVRSLLPVKQGRD